VIAALSLAACSSGTRPVPKAREAAPDLARVGDGRAEASAALRCEECHARIAADWRRSAHARAVDDPLYRAMGPDATCEPCHAPLRAAVDAASPAAKEGVGCDGCHLIAGVETTADGSARMIWAAHGATKLGPRCDAVDHYFHKMGCSPLHESSRLCAGCHEWTRAGARGPQPVISDYGDWRRSAAEQQGLECQSCHMRSIDDEIARGGQRLKLHDHGFLGDDLRARAVTLSAEPTDGALGVRLRNSGAGHALPAGMPEHRVVLRVRLFDGGGRLLREEERAYGRVMVDGQGAVVPFLRAERVAADTRLLPEVERRERFAAPAGTARAEVAVVWRRVARELVAALGSGPAASGVDDERELAHATVVWKARR
jgi:hypothetical protein